MLYNSTGWEMPETEGFEAWLDRVERCETWAHSIGFLTARTASIGMEPLVHRERGWPRQGMQFCTEHLKIKPTLAWLAEHDPGARALCVNGKRKAESMQRAETVEFVSHSILHGGRALWQPLFLHDEERRDDLIRDAGFEVLPHKSKECRVCINENRQGLRRTPETVIADVERIETDLGFTGSGKPRTMFRPARKMGATGIREVVRWAHSAPGQFTLEDGTGPSETDTGCDGGFCAS